MTESCSDSPQARITLAHDTLSPRQFRFYARRTLFRLFFLRICTMGAVLSILKNWRQWSNELIFGSRTLEDQLRKFQESSAQEKKEFEDQLRKFQESSAQEKQESEARISELTSQLQNLKRAHSEEQRARKALEEDLSQCRSSNEKLRRRINEIEASNPGNAFINWVSQKQKHKLRNALEEDLSECRRLNQNLQRRIDEIESANAVQNPGNFYSDSSATPTLLQTMITRVTEAALSFAKVLQPHVEPCQYAHIFAKRTHRLYFIASIVCRTLFSGFENDDFGINDGYCTVADPAELRKQAFKTYELFREASVQDMLQDSSFHNFWSSKSSNLNLEIRDDLEKSVVTESFSKLAKQVWLIHKVAFSFYPSPAAVLRFSDGAPFDARFMESVSVDDEDRFQIEQVVGFMVIPGFRVRDQAFKSCVYPKLLKLHESLDLRMA